MFLGALLVLAAAGSAAGFELKLWPLVHVVSRGSETRLTLLGPLLEWRADTEGSSFTLRPIFRRTHSTASGKTEGSFLYPFVSWDSSEQDFFVRFFGLGRYARSGATRELTIFPLIFFRQSAEDGTSLSILPLYANVRGFFGFQRIRMFLFPLYLKLEEPLYERTWLPFPFYSWVGGRSGEGVRVWPLYGRTRLGLDSDTRYVLWPFYIRQTLHPGRADQTTTRLSWPLFSAIDGPTLQSRSYAFLLLVLPLYTHTIDSKNDTETYGFPWPVEVYQVDRKTGRRISLRLAPFYQDSELPATRSTFLLWPFYRHKTGRGDASDYERTDSFLVIYRDQSEGEGKDRLETDVLVPLWISRGRPGRGSAQALTLLDGISPKNETLAELYAPLYRLYGSERDGESTRRDLLLRMWEWGDGKLRPPWYLSFD